MTVDTIHTRIDSLYKQAFGSLLNTLLQRFPDLDFETVEDLVQESFSAALIHWQRDGIPNNPAGWLFTVARNKAINLLRDKSRYTRAIPDQETAAEEGGDPPASAIIPSPCCLPVPTPVWLQRPRWSLRSNTWPT